MPSYKEKVIQIGQTRWRAVLESDLRYESVTGLESKEEGWAWLRLRKLEEPWRSMLLAR